MHFDTEGKTIKKLQAPIGEYGDNFWILKFQ